MWVAEFKVWHEGSVFLGLSKKLGVTCFISTTSVYERKGRTFVSRTVTATGANAREFLNGIAGEERIELRHLEGNTAYIVIESKASHYNNALNPDVVTVKPVKAEAGFEYWTLASWDKSALEKFAETAGRKVKVKIDIELLWIRKMGVNAFQGPQTDLTSRQLECISKAVEEGYYDYPRKATLRELGKKLGCSLTTVREHLRKAEKAVLKTLF